MNRDLSRLLPEPDKASSTTSRRPSWESGAAAAGSRGGRPRTSTAACAPCKKAHLACDDSRPCRRCVGLAREESCIDLPSKKRGRPKLSTIPGSSGSAGKKRKPSDPSQQASAPAASIPSPPRPTSSSLACLNQQLQPYLPHQLPIPSPLLPAPTASSYAPNVPSSNFFPSNFSLAPAPSSTSATLITTTDFVIIRATSSSSSLLGYAPGSLYMQRLSSILSQEDSQNLEPVRRWLAEPPGHALWTSADALDMVEKVGEDALLAPAMGTPQPANDVLLRRGNGSWQSYNLRIHLGMGTGLVLNSPQTHSRAYFVISLISARPVSPHTRSSSSNSSRTITSNDHHLYLADRSAHSPASVASPPIVPKDYPRPYTSSALPNYHDPSRPTLPPLSVLTSSLDPQRRRPYSSNTRHPNPPSSINAILSNPLSLPLPRPSSDEYRPTSSAGDFNLPFSIPYDHRPASSRSSFDAAQSSISPSDTLSPFHSLNLSTPSSPTPRSTTPTLSVPCSFNNSYPSSSSRPNTALSQLSEQTVATPGIVDAPPPGGWSYSDRGSYVSTGSTRSSTGGDWPATGSGFALTPYLDEGRRPSPGGYFTNVVGGKLPHQAGRSEERTDRSI